MNTPNIIITPSACITPFGSFLSSPKGAENLRQVGRDDLMKHLEITEKEAAELQDIGIDFTYWFTGKDHENCKKWTSDGDDVYSDFSVRNFFLASICDMVKGAKHFNHLNTVNRIKAVEGLHKWLHFSEDRVTIKDMYFGQWKNFWKFVH